MVFSLFGLVNSRDTRYNPLIDIFTREGLKKVPSGRPEQVDFPEGTGKGPGKSYAKGIKE